MKIFFLYFFILFFLSCSNTKTIKIDLENEIIIPKTYNVFKTSEKIIIDGKDNEDSWKKSIFSEDFIDIEGVIKPKQKTNMKMMWDEKFLYIFAKLEENHIWGDITERDKIIYYNNDFEVFINPNNHVFSYGEIEINALGTEWDLFLNKPYRLKGKADSKWNIKELKSAVFINGTINNPNDIDNYWTVEMAIPIKEISQLKDPFDYHYPKSNDIWRINFSRVNWDYELNKGKYSRKKENGKYLPEYNWVWSSQGLINMHVPENWGFLVFSEKNLGSNISFNHSKKLIVEQTLYALFRKVSFKEFRYLNDLKNNSQINFENIVYNNREISCNFLKTETGFIINAYDYNNNIKLSISENGLIKNLTND